MCRPLKTDPRIRLDFGNSGPSGRSLQFLVSNLGEFETPIEVGHHSHPVSSRRETRNSDRGGEPPGGMWEGPARRKDNCLLENELRTTSQTTRFAGPAHRGLNCVSTLCISRRRHLVHLLRPGPSRTTRRARLRYPWLRLGKPESVTHVPGLFCHLCSRLLPLATHSEGNPLTTIRVPWVDSSRSGRIS